MSSLLRISQKPKQFAATTAMKARTIISLLARLMLGSIAFFVSPAMVIAGWDISQDNNPAATAFTPAWQSLSIGGGGEMNNITVSPSDGTLVTAANTYGAYLYKTTGTCAGADQGGWGTTRAAPCWEQLFTQTSATLTQPQIYNLEQGVNDIVVCNNNTNDAYAWYNKTLWGTTNLLAAASSRKWTATSFTTTISGNDGVTSWHSIACDPANPNIVYASNASGVSASGNAGSSFSVITGIGTVGSAVDLIAFDGTPSAPTQSCTQYTGSPTCTKHIMILVAGTGAFESYNGGSSFTATTGGPTATPGTACAQSEAGGVCFNLKTDKFGNFYAVIGDAARIYKYVPNGTAGGGTWSNLTPANNNQTAIFAIDNTSSSVGTLRMVAAYSDGFISVSTNGGGSWCSWSIMPWSASGAQPSWFTNANQGAAASPKFFAAKDLEFDTSGNLYLGAGIGVWSIASASVTCGATWTANSVGIENLVTNHVDGPPGDGTIMAVWDRGFFTALNPDIYPTHYWPDTTYDNTLKAIVGGWGLDWASSASSTLTGFAAFQSTAPGFSSDGGNTFAAWTTTLSWNGTSGGATAASSPTNWISTNGGNSSSLFFTTNAAASAWTAATITGVGTISGSFGSGFSLAADRVNASTFCLHDSNHAVFSSTNSGANWTKVINAGVINTGNTNSALKAIPGQAATFYVSGGNQGGSVTNLNFYKITKTTSECDTATLVNANFTDIYGWGPGAPKPGGNGFPTLYYWGSNNGVYGLWEIDNGGTTASLINVPASQQTWPNNSGDYISDVSGDMNFYGRVYVGHHGSGATYIDKQDACPVVEFSNIKPNATISGTMTLQATASGKPQVTISKVDFYIDSTLIGTQTTPSSGAGTAASPYVFQQSFNTASVGAGAHTLQVATTGNGCNPASTDNFANFKIPVTK